MSDSAPVIPVGSEARCPTCGARFVYTSSHGNVCDCPTPIPPTARLLVSHSSPTYGTRTEPRQGTGHERVIPATDLRAHIARLTRFEDEFADGINSPWREGYVAALKDLAILARLDASLANAKTSANPGISGADRVDSEAQIGPATVARPGPRHQEDES